AGRCTTSPAAIWLATWSGRSRIRSGIPVIQKPKAPHNEKEDHHHHSHDHDQADQLRAGAALALPGVSHTTGEQLTVGGSGNRGLCFGECLIDTLVAFLLQRI